MCQISHKIKFCTCSNEDPETFKNYWIFYRYDKNRKDFVIGEVSLFIPFNEEMVQYNEATLLQRINEHDAFDIDLQPKSKDRLLVVLQCEPHFSEGLNIGFEFKKDKWIPCEYNSLEWMWKHAAAAEGKIEE
jgi:hypothetical protein